jgi:hypothetical protein
MPVSMAVRIILAAALLLLAGCGGGTDEPRREVRLLAPAGVAPDATRFERETDCRVDLRVYDENEDLDSIARRRDADVVAGPAPRGATPHVTQELVRVTIEEGLEVTLPRELASAFRGHKRPAGRRALVWEIRDEGDNDTCARRWLAYATSQ